MAYGLFKANEYNANESGLRSSVAANSLVVKSGTALTAGASWVTTATAGSTIMWISVTDKTFDSDNFTVKKEGVIFKPEPNMDNLYQLPITGGTITLADEWVSYYDIVIGSTANSFAVNGASESSSTGQLLLVKYVSSTIGIFRVVNI